MGKKVRLTIPAGRCLVVSAQDKKEAVDVLQVPNTAHHSSRAVSKLS